jgi:transcriptional regulator with XRE-family HTH domain
LENKSNMKEILSTTPTMDINQRLAQRLASLRAERGMSLDVLAAQSKVSRSMISLIERGESSPTAVVLDKLSTALGVTLASLFEDPQPQASPLVRRNEQLQWKDPQSGYVRRNVSPPHFPSPVQIVEVEFPPGARVAYEATGPDHVLQQQIWVLEGRMEMLLEGGHHRLEAGDCLAMQESQSIVYQNTSDSPARYVVVLSRELGSSFSSTFARK